jgi:hypothetical protein
LSPVGEGKYAIVKHQNYAELTYILEMPEQRGEAQRELGIEKETSYIISVINPIIARPSTSQAGGGAPRISRKVLKEFNKTENFLSLAKDTKFIDYQNAQIILIGSREGRDVIKSDIDVETEEEESPHSADIFNKLKVRKKQIAIRPLTEGKLELYVCY